MLAIIDYGMGNLRSIANALDFLSIENEITAAPDRIKRADRLILPGVGAFGAAMSALSAKGLDDLLDDQVRRSGKPLLGICLGMQLIASRSHENGLHDGFGWVEGEVVRIEPGDAALKIPHIGWNLSEIDAACSLFNEMPSPSDFYFLHSYTLKCDPAVTKATTEYGSKLIAAVAQDNVMGTQFHPEKSQMQGLTVLKNFASFPA